MVARTVLSRGDGARDPEVAYDRVARFKQDVFRLDVPVDYVMTVGIAQGVGHFASDLERVVEGQLLLPTQPVPQRLAFDVGHDVIEATVSLARVMKRQDVRMGEPSGDLDLAQEALGPDGGAKLGAQDLERNGPVVAKVVGEIDRRHSPAAEFALDRVTPGEGDLKAAQLVCQDRKSTRLNSSHL